MPTPIQNDVLFHAWLYDTELYCMCRYLTTRFSGAYEHVVQDPILFQTLNTIKTFICFLKQIKYIKKFYKIYFDFIYYLFYNFLYFVGF